MAQINIEDPSDTYNLTATAANSEGSDRGSINLDWQCAIPNSPPIVGEIMLDTSVSITPPPPIYSVNGHYHLEIAANDPDGDSLEYT